MNRLLRFLCGAVVTIGRAQTPLSDLRPSFDVASIKMNNSGTGVDRLRNNNGSLMIDNFSLKRILAMAYGVPESQGYLFSGPDWLDSTNFDIHARFPQDTPELKRLLMLQRLLEDRFRMELHREPREFSVLALVSGKGKQQGLKLKPADTPEAAYRFRVLRGHAVGFSISMPMLAGRLSRPDFDLGRPVVDFTGLAGTFDLTLDWKSDGGQDQNADSSSDASIYAAIQEQLGLRLEPRRVSLEVLVIDRLNKAPTEN
jgi:uncharacterized protein (TIGR03435 family)